MARSAKISFDFFSFSNSFSALLIKIKVDYETNTNDDYVKQLRRLLHPSAVYITHTRIHPHTHTHSQTRNLHNYGCRFLWLLL